MSYFFRHLAAPFGPLTPGSIQRHATFLTRDLRAPSGGSEYHLEVRESADWLDCLQTNRDLVIKFYMKLKFLFCQDVRCVFQSLFQVCFNMFYKFGCIFFGCRKLPSIATRDLSQLPLLPTKVMRCEGWNCSWWNMSRLWKMLETQGSQGLFLFSFMLKRSFLFSGGRVSTFPS